ncbi:MAG: hypothetical protein AAFU70_02470, partial [Planctomycetota bacterium]
MTGDPLRKVRTGEPLKIPAAAYNAFVDAAVGHRSRDRNAVADPQREIMQRGVVLVRNDSEQTIEPYHAMAITGVLVEPGDEDQERTFYSRTPLTGEIATEDSPPLAFVLATQPIKAGDLGRCALTGVTPARVYITSELDTTCEIEPEETVLASRPMGGVPILFLPEGRPRGRAGGGG